MENENAEKYKTIGVVACFGARATIQIKKDSVGNDYTMRVYDDYENDPMEFKATLDELRYLRNQIDKFFQET